MRGVARGIAALLIAVGVATAGSAAHAQQRADLSGRWELRDRAAEDAPEEAAPPERPEVAPPPGREGRPPPRRAPGGMSEKDRQQIGRLLGMAQAVPSFELQQTDSTLIVTNEDGFSYTVRLDGTRTELTVADSLRIETDARWDDGHLVVEFRPEGGGKLTERYALADSRLFLRLEVTVEHPRLRRRIWRSRMYRRVEDPAP